MQVDLWSLLLQVVNFLILVWILQRFLYKPILAVIARRQQKIDGAVADAESLRARAAIERQTYEERLAEIEAERDRDLRKDRAVVAAERQTMLETAKTEAAAISAEARRGVDQERHALATEVSGKALSLAVDITQRMLSETDGYTVTTALLRQACEHLAKLPADKRELLRSEAVSNSGVTVALACALDDAQTSDCRRLIAERLGLADGSVRFVVEPSLIAGVEFRSPHTAISFNWRDGLADARNHLLHDESRD